MGWADRIAGWFGGESETDSTRSASSAPPASRRRAVTARSTSRHTTDAWSLPFAPQVILPPDERNATWRRLDLDKHTLDKVDAVQLVEFLADMSPDVARAIWDHMRMCNPGYEIRAFRPGGDDVEDERAKAALGEMKRRLDDIYGSFDAQIGRLFIGGWIRGAFFAEIVIAQAGRGMVDLIVPDAASVRFRQHQDPERGAYRQLGQVQRGEFVPLEYPTVRYVPVDPFPGSPYGRSPMHPAIFPTMFLIGMLHDLRRVVSQQGYPRIDISVLMETLRDSMPTDIQDDPDAFRDYVDGAIDDVVKAYSALEPDDAYVHTDVIQVNRPVGTVDSSTLGAVEGLITALERMSVRALKTMPLMMGTTDGVSEANANRQWEIYAAGIKSMQHAAETLLEGLFTEALRSMGIQARVEMRFAELRAAEMMRDEQTRQLANSNAAFEYFMGWRSHDEVAQERVGHDPAETGPLAEPAGFDPLTTSTQDPEPGSNRLLPLRALHPRSPAITPSGDPLALPSVVVITEGDKRAMLESWDTTMDGYESLLDAAVDDE